jgi:hypothetical protein
MIVEDQSPSRRGSTKAHRQPGSPPAMEDLVPYSAKEKKHLRTLWDEAQRQRKTGLPYRNIYVGVMGLILAGLVFSWVGRPFSPQIGGILMFVGGSIGAFFSLKSLRQNRLSAKRG